MNKGMKPVIDREPRSQAHAERFSASIPDYLYSWGEQERERRGLNRSEFVAYLYQRLFDEVEHERRKAQYSAAYARFPVTEEEEALSALGVETLSSEAP